MRMQLKACKYCQKMTRFTNNQGEPVCETEYICENTKAPTFDEEMGPDPTGRDWNAAEYFPETLGNGRDSE